MSRFSLQQKRQLLSPSKSQPILPSKVRPTDHSACPPKPRMRRLTWQEKERNSRHQALIEIFLAFTTPKIMKNQKPVNRVSKEQSSRNRIYSVIADTFKLEHPLCECCPKIRPSKPRQWTVDVHHSHGKIGLLMFYLPWFIATCRRCHQWLDCNRAEARKLGLLCPLGQWNVQPPFVCIHNKLLTEPCAKCATTAKAI